MTLAELLDHGSFGIGTSNELDGEIIILDGAYYRLCGDGSVSVPELTERAPYAVATNFISSLSRSSTGPMTRKELSRAADAFVSSSNYTYALRVTGRFAQTSARAVTRQDRPYQPMIKVIDGEKIARHEDFSGTIAGFRTPLYKSGISATDCHAHTVDGDHTWGEHLVDLVLKKGGAELCPGTDFHTRPPLIEEFCTTDLSKDMTEEIRRIKHH